MGWVKARPIVVEDDASIPGRGQSRRKNKVYIEETAKLPLTQDK